MSLWSTLFDLFNRPVVTDSVTPGKVFLDRRKTAAQAHGPGGKWKVGRRPWSKVTGICLHQTACWLGERPERWDTVGAHIGITRAGRVIWLHDFTHLVAHGNGWNNQTVGIEIDGLYAGVKGDPSTVWDDPDTAGHETEMELTIETIISAKETISWIVRECATYNANISALVAHRQSSKDRRNDPGSAIWKSIALPMSDELVLSDGGPGFAIGGYPIPEAWDSSRVGIKY
jgi:hypothetical protein